MTEHLRVRPGQVIIRRPGGHPISYQDERIPRGIQMLVTHVSASGTVTLFFEPEGGPTHVEVVYTYDLRSPDFAIIGIVGHDELSAYKLEVIINTLECIAVEKGMRLRRTGRPLQTRDDCMPKDVVITIIDIADSLDSVGEAMFTFEGNEEHYWFPLTGFMISDFEIVA